MRLLSVRQLGQFGMPQGKWNVYETSVRVPLLARGPGVARGAVLAPIASLVDVGPTLMELAGVAAAPAAVGAADASADEEGDDDYDTAAVDGRSFAPFLRPAATATASADAAAAAALAGWRSELLLEYSGGDVVRYAHLEDAYNNSFRALRVVSETADLLCVSLELSACALALLHSRPFYSVCSPLSLAALARRSLRARSLAACSLFFSVRAAAGGAPSRGLVS